ncbi:lysozyme inhibitor LprI family protein [Thalassovita sp.]|uniref:lysozyme inhibitor LprI family protein n=1 Tax=Thalassovita sp. TaxID=1979401 RepID=UPI002B267F06|nr:lysozyme inhibitor LprI family protein [Thalassovita sp.]
MKLIITLSALLATSGAAQALDCSAPQTQQDMNQCAYQMWQYADEDLNLAYQMARDFMRTTDSYLPENLKGAEAALRDAQRAWIPFRDNACAAEGFAFRGGSMEPLMVLSCKERLTRQRTEELRSLSEMN